MCVNKENRLGKKTSALSSTDFNWQAQGNLSWIN